MLLEFLKTNEMLIPLTLTIGRTKNKFLSPKDPNKVTSNRSAQNINKQNAI